MISLYRPGSSVLHGMRAGLKVLLFALAALAVGVLATNPVAVAVAALAVVAAYLLAGFGVVELARQVLAARWVILVMAVTQLIFLPAVVAATNTGRVTLVIVLAGLLTLTTRVPDLVDVVEWAARPLRRFGVDPATLSLLFAITITAIPVIAGFAAEIRGAQRARGVRLLPHAVVVPLLVMSLKYADDLAEAMVARGAD